MPPKKFVLPKSAKENPVPAMELVPGPNSPPKKDPIPGNKLIPDPRRKLTPADFKATTNKLRVSADQIARMEKKIGEMKSEMKAHPLLSMDIKEEPKPEKTYAPDLGMRLLNIMAYYNKIPTEEVKITLKNRDSLTHDIHKARDVQKLIENRRRFFNGEFEEGTTLAQVGSHIMKGNLSSDDDDTPSAADSGRATYGSSVASGRDEILNEVTPDPNSQSKDSMLKSSGYSEDDELSVADSCDTLADKLTLFQQKVQAYDRKNKESDRKCMNEYKQMLIDPNVSHEDFMMAKRYLRPDDKLPILPKANYKPELRGQKKLTKVPSSEKKPWTPYPNPLGKKTPRRLASFTSQNSDKKLTNSVHKRGWTAFKKAKALGVSSSSDEESDDDSSSDEMPTTPNLSLLQSTGPARSEPKFSMTKTIETTRKTERAADIRMGLIGLSKKKGQTRYGPIAPISSRIPGTALSWSKKMPTWNGLLTKSSLTTSTPKSKPPTRPGVPTKSSTPAYLPIWKRPNTPRVHKLASSTSFIKPEDLTAKDKISRRKYIHAKYNNINNLPRPRIVPEPVKREEPVYTPWGESESSESEVDLNSIENEPKVLMPPMHPYQPSLTAQLPSLSSLRNTKDLYSWVPKNFAADKAAAMSLHQKNLALRGESRPDTGKENGFVPMKDDDEKPKGMIESNKKVATTPPKYNKLQMKRDIRLPGEPDIDKDPRYWYICEIIDRPQEPIIKTWKGMPTPENFEPTPPDAEP